MPVGSVDETAVGVLQLQGHYRHLRGFRLSGGIRHSGRSFSQNFKQSIHSSGHLIWKWGGGVGGLCMYFNVNLSVEFSHTKPCYCVPFCQSSWSKGISETNLNRSHAVSACMHCPMMSQADAFSYCLGSVSISSWIYLYLQLGNRYSVSHKLFGVKWDETRWIVTKYWIFEAGKLFI